MYTHTHIHTYYIYLYMISNLAALLISMALILKGMFLCMLYKQELLKFELKSNLSLLHSLNYLEPISSSFQIS